MFCWSRHLGGCFAENRHIVFLWKLSGKEHVMFCWGRCLEGQVTFGKAINIAQQTVDDAARALAHLAFLADRRLLWLCKEKCTKEFPVTSCHFCVGSGWLAEPFRLSWIELLILTHVSWAAGILTTETGFAPKELFLNSSTSSFALITFPFYYIWWVVI